MNKRRAVNGHKGLSPREMLSALSAMPDAEHARDGYGSGEYITGFEQQTATLLGKEAAVFMPSGTMCQQIALRIQADRRNGKNVAFHPTCHLEIYEEQAYRHLHGLNGVLVGAPNSLLTLSDLERVRDPLTVLLLELPQREIGGQLPSWEELQAQIAWARERNIATHLDGARLWECQPFYGRDYAKIAALFDTVYVSFYKILGGIAGAALAGPGDIIREARVWQRRHGGNLPTLYPLVLAAQRGLEIHLPRIPDYCRKAQQIAEGLRSLPDLAILPDPPHTNMMHVFLRATPDQSRLAAQDLSEETDTDLRFGFRPADVPGWSRFEWSVGEAALDIPTDKIVSLITELTVRAAATTE
jgi:threonine aldolase